MKQILITGGQGMLATDLRVILSLIKHYQVRALSHRELDVTDAGRLQEAVAELKPSVLIHTAAMHVDPCEENSSDAFRVNAWATRSLARICQKYDVELVCISTCGLFGNGLRAYSEYDPVVLKTVYARSKFSHAPSHN